MRRILILLALAAMVAACCKSGKQTEVKEESMLDSALQVKAEAALREAMTDCWVDRGQVVVMDIEKGAIVASTGLAMVGDSTRFDTVEFADEKCISGMSRLEWNMRMLESGKMTLDEEVDAGEGVLIVGNDTIVDYNWRRGGYGRMTNRNAIAMWVNTTYFKCLAKVYGEKKALEIFYNNKEISVVEAAMELRDSIVLRNDEYADSIKSVMRYYVTNGLGGKAESDKVEIAGYCNNSITDNGTFVLDFYAYFPWKNPKYIVVVRMKKRGLPASANRMCGPVVKGIAEGIEL